jgi:glycerophosphoryl diester phosphodiesterase
MKKLSWAFLFAHLYTTQIHALELFSHRGVRQTYPHSTGNCTAAEIFKPRHDFIELTLPSIEEAFRVGADTVQIAVHRTEEADGSNDVVVFHDWDLRCRTNADSSNCENGDCTTRGQSLSFIKSLDAGYGYSNDGGSTFPFRGRFYGEIPSLHEAIDLLYNHSEKSILINQKDNDPLTLRAILKIVGEYPISVRSRVQIPDDIPGFTDELKRLGMIDGPSYKTENCFKKYIALGWSGHFPKECRNRKLMVHLHLKRDGVKMTSLLWGWPEKFIQRAHKHGSSVVVFGVDDIADLTPLKDVSIDGIMSGRVEVISPEIGGQ